jgi:FkbM family methyltransferase
LGDYFSENPFFKPETNSEEIIASVAWCMQKEKPVIFDIGAHCGYFSTHFAGLLKQLDPRIYAFEPVTPTFLDLIKTIDTLKLQENVFPIQAALSNKDEIVTMSYSKWESMLAHVVRNDHAEPANAGNSNVAVATTVNKIAGYLGCFPDLIKLDVEGYETFVLQGADNILEKKPKPAICIEWNPDTLKQCGSSAEELLSLLVGYDLYYLNDYLLGKRKFLDKMDDIISIPWVCNLFALPKGAGIFEQWKNNIEKIIKQYNISIPQC